MTSSQLTRSAAGYVPDPYAYLPQVPSFQLVSASVAGGQPDARAAVLRLVDDLGFDPVDAGGLDESWRQQPGTLAYCRDLDAAALRRALAEAEHSRIADYRGREEGRIARSMNAQPAQRSGSS